MYIYVHAVMYVRMYVRLCPIFMSLLTAIFSTWLYNHGQMKLQGL